jgi:subtilisin family serine protease
MKLNAVKFKDKKSFDKNKTKLNVKEVHEPFQIIVFEDEKEVTPDLTKVSSVNQVEQGLEVIPTGLAICIANDFIAAETFFQTHKVKIKDSYKISKTFVVEMNVPNFDEFKKWVANSGYFVSIEPDQIYKAEKSGDFYTYDQHWHLPNIKAQEGWALMPSGVVGDVAVLDLGCETNHEDLQGATNLNWNCVTDTNNVEPVVDDEKHGTACSGIIAARTDNNVGCKSVGNNHLRVQFMQIGYNVQGGSFSTTDSILTKAINKAMENPNCLAISMSFGGTGVRPNFENSLNIARTQGRGGKGIACFASSGNGYLTEFTQYPAYYNAVMAIGASNTVNQKTGFSNAGSKLFAAVGGSGILTTDRMGMKGYTATGDPTKDNYASFSGTSASCPLFAGIAAMCLLKNPNLTEVQLRELFKKTCRKTGGYTYTNGRSNELGYGVAELNAALIEAGNGGVDPQPIPVNLTSFVSVPMTATAGTAIPVSFSAKTTNAAMPSTTIECKVWLSPTAQVGSTSILITTSNLTLGGGKETDSNIVSYNIPAPISGNYFVIAQADTKNAVIETSETDNSSSATIQINAPSSTGLDMGVKVTKSEWLADGRLRVSYSFSNLGNETITSSKIVAEFVGGYKTTWNRLDVIRAGQTINLSSVYPSSTFPPSFPATYRLTILNVNGRTDLENQNESKLLINR